MMQSLGVRLRVASDRIQSEEAKRLSTARARDWRLFPGSVSCSGDTFLCEMKPEQSLTGLQVYRREQRFPCIFLMVCSVFYPALTHYPGNQLGKSRRYHNKIAFSK